MEEWKPVVGFEGVYEVSDLGRVRRIKPASGTQPGKVLRPALDGRGYPHVNLCAGGRQHIRRVHALVAAAFLGPIPPGWQINHKDGDKQNPAAANLEICTQSENAQHAYHALGHQSLNTKATKVRGEANGGSRITEADVLRIRQLRREGQAFDAIAAIYGLHTSHIRAIVAGRHWKHLPL